ncbi:hypothetical protein ACGFX8_35095 [Streptomyces sp. NPDC048362]|uniref:hypothetical protein n=1 Tax=Streptomyces sp. NPDC048362 TaxID=3365539 RepID=UPI003710C8E3
MAIRLAAQLASTSNPRLRYPLVESVEVAGHAFFEEAVKPARQFEEATGKTLVFWGDQHLALEEGHTLGEESLFGVELTPEERTAAVGMVTAYFMMSRNPSALQGVRFKNRCIRFGSGAPTDFLIVHPFFFCNGASRPRRYASPRDSGR